MSISPLNDDLNIVQSLGDRPNALDGLNASQLKAKFDEASNLIKTYINGILIPELAAVTDGDSGADNIGATAIADLDGATIQLILESLRNKLKSTTDGSSGADFIGATTVSGLSGNTVQAILEALKALVDTKDGSQSTALTTHKSSGDHDGRYYTETEIDTNFVSKSELTNTRKLDAAGNFTGSWFGFTSPSASDPGIQMVVNEHTAQLADIAINVKSFGAAGDGVTDDTDAIREAISATPKGGTLIFPPSSGGYYVTTPVENYLFLIDKPMNIVGYGLNSMILLDNAIPDTCDVFLVSPDPAKGTEGYTIEGITVFGASGRPARHAIHLDITNSGQLLKRMLIHRNFLFPTGGHSIYLTNPTNTDGFFTSQIEKNYITAGISLVRCGDSVMVKENTISNYNGLIVSLVTGAKEFIFAYNNFTARNGIIITEGDNCKFIYNNLEVAYSDASFVNNAFIDLDGGGVSAAFGMLNIEFCHNDITYQGVSPDFDAVRIGKSRRALVENNRISAKNGRHLNITNSAQNTMIGYNLYNFTDPQGDILDNGLQTLYKEVHVDTSALEHEVWFHQGATVRSRGTTRRDMFSTFQKETNSSGISAHNYIWKEANVSSIKHAIGSQRRQTSGTLDTATDIMYFLSDRVLFPSVGLSVRDDSNIAHRIVYRAAAPTTGTWAVGDIAYNSAPTASGKIGWVCVTAGTPGTWKAFGVIDA